MPDTLTWVPTTATQGRMVPRTLRAQFGDGYVQEMADGINGMLRTWDVTYEPIHALSGTNPTLQMLNDFFTAQGGYKKFLWTQPKPFHLEGLKTFVCTDWMFSYQQGLIVGFRAVFQQRPD